MSNYCDDVTRRDFVRVGALGSFGFAGILRAGEAKSVKATNAVFDCLGGGIRGGRAVGASDDKGMGPAGAGFMPDQLAATFYHTLGIDHAKEYRTASGRPVMIVRDGSVIKDLFA